MVYIPSSSSSSTESFNRAIERADRAIKALKNKIYARVCVSHLKLIPLVSTLTFDDLKKAIKNLDKFSHDRNDDEPFPADEDENTLFYAIMTNSNPHLTDNQRAELLYLLFKEHTGYQMIFFYPGLVRMLSANAAYHDVLMRMYTEACSDRYVTSEFYRRIPENNKSERDVWKVFIDNKMYAALLAPFLVRENHPEILRRILEISKMMLKESEDPVATYGELSTLFDQFKHKVDWSKYVFQMAEFALLRKAWRFKSEEKETQTEGVNFTREGVKTFLESKSRKGFFGSLLGRGTSNPLSQICDKIFDEDAKADDLLKSAKETAQNNMNVELNKKLSPKVEMRIKM